MDAATVTHIGDDRSEMMKRAREYFERHFGSGHFAITEVSTDVVASDGGRPLIWEQVVTARLVEP